MYTSIQCTGNKSRFLKIEHILNLIWPSDNLPFKSSFQAKNVKLFTDNVRPTAIGYQSISSDLKKYMFTV